MGVLAILGTPPPRVLFEEQDSTTTKMSQDYNHHHHHEQQNIFTFSNDYDRSTPQQPQEHHIAQQIRREKLRVPGFETSPSLVSLDQENESGGLQYDTGVGTLSEMFNFPLGVSNPTELLDNNIPPPPTYHRSPRLSGVADTGWYENHQQGMGQLGDPKNHHHQIDSAAAMQLFLMNPQPPRSPSPSSSSHHQPPSTLHMLLPTPASNSNLQGFQHPSSSFGQFAWPPPNNEIGGATVIEGQGLSLSLSSLQHLEAAKSEEFRMGDNGGMMFYNNLQAYNQYRNYGGGVGQGQSQSQPQVHVGYGSSSLGVVNVLRTSKYVKAAQELLEEFCSVGRGQFKKNKFARVGSTNPNPRQTPSGAAAAAAAGAGSSSSSKDPHPPLSAADRIEHQRRKVKLLSMLDEVDRRYNHYCEQMQMVVNSFDLVMGFGSAIPYTTLAQKAMSRHFRCLKDAISTQLKHSCELLGDKDAGTSGVTKGETPRLKLLEQSLRQQRAFHQMGMMEQEAWRPQRGLPERSVNILRAWLFEHFLHPYPSDADKHLLARQTGLSRNQVSNWFINARVRLWKPMVEEMYQKESKEEAIEEEGEKESTNNENNNNTNPPLSNAQTPILSSSTSTKSTIPTSNLISSSHIHYSENDPSLHAINAHYKHGSHVGYAAVSQPLSVTPYDADMCRRSMGNHDHYATTNADVGGSTLISFGTTSGDVSLTLGLRHAGNLPDNANFSVRDFGGC